MRNPVFTGSGVAVITPFTRDGVDDQALKKLIECQIGSGTDAIIVCGTTGEGSTLTEAERLRVTETAVQTAGGRVPVIAGTGSNDTRTAIRLSRDAVLAGADALLVVTPYYNKATQRGLIAHYTAVADAVERPVILYNVPSRTGVSIAPETYAALSRHPNIVGTKEAGGSFAQIQKTMELCGKEFSVWSGNDEDTAAVCLLGGQGVISVAANVIPREMHELTEAALRGDLREAGRLQLKYRRLMAALFCEVNPIPVKTALHLMGCCAEEFRLPLCRMEEENRLALRRTMEEYGLL